MKAILEDGVSQMFFLVSGITQTTMVGLTPTSNTLCSAEIIRMQTQVKRQKKEQPN